MSQHNTFARTSKRPTVNTPSIEDLIPKKYSADSMSLLIDIASLLATNQPKFQRLERLPDEPLLSFAEICSESPKLKGSLAPHVTTNETKTKTTTPTATRKSSRVAEKKERARSMTPLVDLSRYRIPESARASPHKTPGTSRKRRRSRDDKDGHAVEPQAQPDAQDASLPRPKKKARRTIRHAALVRDSSKSVVIEVQ